MHSEERAFGTSAAADRFMSATREFIRAATTTALPDDELGAATDTLRALTSSLDAQRNHRGRRIPFTVDEGERIRAGGTWRMFPFTPLGIPQEIAVSGDHARSLIPLNAAHEGPPEMLHGGFGAAILDALLGVLVMVAETPAVTVELTTTYLAPTPLDRTVLAHGTIVERRGRTIVAEGAITVDGRDTVRARGVFVPFAMPPGPQR